MPDSPIFPYNDINTKDQYQLARSMGLSEEEALLCCYRLSRDNARTPMQWSAGEQAGFTKGSPWIQVNPNYRRIHAAGQMEDEDSIFHYYQRLIQLRKDMDVIAYGDFTPLDERNPSVLAYERSYGKESLLVICNFYGREAVWESKADLTGYQRVLGNYPVQTRKNIWILRPYEALVLYRENRSI